MKNEHYHIHIIVDGRTRDEAITLLKKTIQEIDEGETDCSEHDDTYMPYRFWSCFYREDKHMSLNITDSPCGC